ncbi:MAG: hypothetical protein GXO77_14125 [Calditrichaeota bacterium]|nr:hypothetical protein [Calditrichota bacterium]
MKPTNLFFGIFILIAFFILPKNDFVFAQNEKPQKVYRIIYVQKPNEWYLKQAKLWEREVKKNPQNPEAWRNYFLALRYSRPTQFTSEAFKNRQEKLKKIIAEMGKSVPDSYEYYYLKYKYYAPYKKADISWLKKAYQLQPEKAELYYDFIVYYAIHDNQPKLKEFLRKLYQSKDIAPGLLNYNYNVLASCEKNAVLFTNGDNDTYPAWILQTVKNVRPDVTVINLNLAMGYPDYLKSLLNKKNIRISADDLKGKKGADFLQELIQQIHKNYQDIPIYIALTLNANYLKNIEDNLYIVGLAYQYSTDSIDNLAILKMNLEKNLRLDYLKNNWYDEQYLANASIDQINLNYVIVFMKLAEHLNLSGQKDDADYWKNFALRLAKKAGNEKLIEYINSKTF